MVPRLLPICAGALLVAGLTACGGSSTPNPIKEAFAQHAPPALPGITVAFRFPRESNQRVRLYALPTLAAVNIEFAPSRAGTADFVGFVREEDLIYTRDTRNELAALDLTAGRFRTVDSLVQQAVLSPTGLPIVILKDLSVGAVRNRTVDLWPTRLPDTPSKVWGTYGSALLAAFNLADGPAIGVATPEWNEHLVKVPFGPMVTSPWGDVLVVATDSGVVAMDPRESAPTRFFRLTERATALSLSPSAHRVYVALATGSLVILNRFDLSELETKRLPGVVEAIRPDPLGRYLLMRPAQSQNIWICPVNDIGNFATATGEWDEHLPAVGPDGTVLVRDGDDVLALDPVSGQATGRIPDPEHDTWALLTWDPRRPTLQVAAERSTQDLRPSSGVAYYAQVSSSSNLNWAQDEVARLTQAGLPATLLPQSAFDDRYRVGLGPFPTREGAEDSGKILGRPYFIVAIDPNDPTSNR